MTRSDETTTRNDWGVRGTEAYAARLSHDRGADGPAPNIEGCTCDRDDESWVGEPGPMPLCPKHEYLRKLSWESLACMVIDYEATLSVPAPTLPVYRCVCGEIEANRVHSDTRLSGWHPYAGESVPAPTLPALDAENHLVRLAANRQMPDENRLTITLGELREALRDAV